MQRKIQTIYVSCLSDGRHSSDTNSRYRRYVKVITLNWVQFLTFTLFWRICELFIWLDTMLQVTSRDFNLNQYHACSPLILSNISNITSWNSAMVFGSWTLDKFGLHCVSCYPPCTPQCSVFMDDICDLPRRWNAFALRTVLF